MEIVSLRNLFSCYSVFKLMYFGAGLSSLAALHSWMKWDFTTQSTIPRHLCTYPFVLWNIQLSYCLFLTAISVQFIVLIFLLNILYLFLEFQPSFLTLCRDVPNLGFLCSLSILHHSQPKNGSSWETPVGILGCSLLQHASSVVL